MAGNAFDSDADATAMSDTLDSLTLRTNDLSKSANSFARTMTQAFSSSLTGGKQFDDVLKSLVLRLSSMSVNMALKPVTSGIAGGMNSLFSGLFGGESGGNPTTLAAAMGAIKPFATGGVVGAPTYFPLSSGGLGLAGEAGPEAIMPLSRGSDGRLGVATSGAGVATNVTVHIATPDANSFRRSEAYLSGQIARAVARGQRSL